MSDINFQNIETQNRYQKFLYGYEYIFNNLVTLYKKNKLPNKIIFNGSDGIGKATLVYHLTNFILSNNESNPYDVDAKEIQQNNKSYLDLVNNSNFNFKIMEQKLPLPPFTLETALEKIQLAEDAWNSQDPERVSKAYTIDSEWRNRDKFVNGREEIVLFLRLKFLSPVFVNKLPMKNPQGRPQ